MQIRYHNTLDHLVTLQKYVLRFTAFGKRMMPHRFIAVEIVIVFISALFSINHNPLKVLLGLVVVSGLAWLFRQRSVLLQFKRERRKDRGGSFDRQRILTIAPDGPSINTGAHQSKHPWDDVESVARDRKHIYIVLKGVRHYVIPLNALADLNEADRFVSTANTYRLP